MTHEQVRLDVKDRKILFELDRNSRLSYVDISKRAKIPVETVRYRVHSLLERGVVQNFFTVIDGGKLGFYYYKVFIKLYNVNEKLVAEMVSFLVSNPTVNWVVRVDGSYDIGFTIKVPNPISLSIFIDQLREKYRTSLHSWILSVNIKMDFLARTYLTQRERRQVQIGSYSAHAGLHSLDKTNQEILRCLAHDPRISASGIAKELHVSDDTVLQRIRKLEQDKIVIRYGLVLNNRLIGQVNNYVLVHLNKLSTERRKEFLKFCVSASNIVYIIKSLGEWDYEINVETATIEEYRKLMMEMTTRFSDIIRDYSSMMIRQINKYTYP